MPKFELLEDKVACLNLKADDHIVVENQLWRVVENYPVIGGGGRMLVLAYYTHQNPTGYKFHPISHSDTRVEVFRSIE